MFIRTMYRTCFVFVCPIVRLPLHESTSVECMYISVRMEWFRFLHTEMRFSFNELARHYSHRIYSAYTLNELWNRRIMYTTLHGLWTLYTSQSIAILRNVQTACSHHIKGPIYACTRNAANLSRTTDETIHIAGEKIHSTVFCL